MSAAECSSAARLDRLTCRADDAGVEVLHRSSMQTPRRRKVSRRFAVSEMTGGATCIVREAAPDGTGSWPIMMTPRGRARTAECRDGRRLSLAAHAPGDNVHHSRPALWPEMLPLFVRTNALPITTIE